MATHSSILAWKIPWTEEHESASLPVMSDSLATPWTITPQALLSMGFSRQEYWRGLPFPTPGDLPDPGTELESPALQEDSLQLSYRRSPYGEQSRTFLPPA